MTTPNNGDTVTIDYTIAIADGTVVGTTEQEGPQTVTLGQGEVFPQIESALTGMEVGQQEQVSVPSENAFGPRREELVADIPRSNLPPEPAPQPGMMLQAQQPDGTPMQLQIVEVGEASVKVDGNHPLAGQDLTFGVTLREIRQAA